MNRPDLDIRQDVESELQWDPIIDDRRIGVIVSDGIVTLTGEVEHLAGRSAAEEITKRVKGVEAIANEIEARIPWSGPGSDTEIATAVAAALRGNLATTSSAITPVVKDGCVTLSGNVTWGFQKLAAEHTIKPLPGVRHVANHIIVTSAMKAAQMKHAIEQALRRHAPHGARVSHVEIEDSTIVLTGQVHSWEEQPAAVSAAWAAPAGRPVENRLEAR